MALLPSKFNAAEGEKLDSFAAIPAGEYLAQIIKSEMKDTKTSGGKYLQLTYQILEGEYVNRQLWARLNLVNQNPQTVEIATKTINTISECCGVALLEDSEQLHNIPMYITVIVKPAQAQYPEQNDIKGFTPYVAGSPATAVPSVKTAAPSKATPPWKKA